MLRRGGAGRLLAFLLAAALPAAPQSPEARATALVRQMTLEEKLSLVHGTRDPRELGQAGYWPGLPRLAIPPLRFADGPPGIHANRDATALPSPVALAATFDRETARQFGMVLGRNAAALEQNVVLAPYVNIVRDPAFRRIHTTLSEDPLLTAELAAAEIRGIQSQGVMAQVKHLAGYNGAQNVLIDERTLHELYLPAFEAAVKAGVASLMCAYNKVNGDWACENADLQNRVLRGLFGFRGFVTSDWGAVHGPEAITKGIDLEMPGRAIMRRGGPYFTAPLADAVKSGAIPLAAVDQAVSRILEPMIRFGLLDRKPSTARAIDIEGDATIVRGIAARGAVLLRNERGLLPLTASDLDSVLLVGPTAGQLAAGFMGERGYGFEQRLVSPLAALRAVAPKASVAYSAGVDLTGVPIPPSALGSGLVRKREAVESAATRIDTSLDFHLATALEPSADFSWSGSLTIAEEGEYTFLVQPLLAGGSEGGGSLSIDGRRVARTGGPGFGGTGMTARKWSSLLPTTDGRDNGRGVLRLTAGQHRIDLTANSTGEGPLSIRFSWITPAMRRAAIDAAVAAARNARTAVVFAWSPAGALDLPEAQDDLIARVAAAAPRTVVVLNTGGPVFMPWKDRVNAILQMWFPGQEGGWATADLLLGRANPGGKLPVTFPARLEDSPAYAKGHPERNAPPAAPGMSGTDPDAPLVRYSEGLAVGYRWFDQERIAPLFPFGFGLSYTQFEYSGLFLRPVREGLAVTFTVRNVGKARGSEVAQVYLGAPPQSPVPMPPRALVAFERLDLDPGASRTLTLRIPGRAFSYWSSERHSWVAIPAARPVWVGSSSRDLVLRNTFGPMPPLTIRPAHRP
jgi:beta-glucosidase